MEPKTGVSDIPFKAGTKRPMYIIHLEQLDTVSENVSRDENISRKLNSIYMSKPMHAVPSNLGNYTKNNKLPMTNKPTLSESETSYTKVPRNISDAIMKKMGCKRKI